MIIWNPHTHVMQFLESIKDLGFCSISVQKNSAAANGISLIRCGVEAEEPEPMLTEENGSAKRGWKQRNHSSAAPCCCAGIKHAADEHLAAWWEPSGRMGLSLRFLYSPDVMQAMTHQASTRFSRSRFRWCF